MTGCEAASGCSAATGREAAPPILLLARGLRSPPLLGAWLRLCVMGCICGQLCVGSSARRCGCGSVKIIYVQTDTHDAAQTAKDKRVTVHTHTHTQSTTHHAILHAYTMMLNVRMMNTDLFWRANWKVSSWHNCRMIDRFVFEIGLVLKKFVVYRKSYRLTFTKHTHHVRRQPRGECLHG